MMVTSRKFTAQINEHVDQCQICQRGTLCDIAEQIIADEEAKQERIRQENIDRKRKQADL